ncbi:MAG: hypothetical protein K1X39_13925 [Thermoflexales bacterium]|mgnify:CR=1 FL=1|nr:hypothetical protein [Thermoflexales bacterium]
MSSFSNPHFMYLFALKSKPGKRRLAYGQSPEDALQILSFRCTQEEMDDIIRDDFEKIHQRELQKYIHLLG